MVENRRLGPAVTAIKLGRARGGLIGKASASVSYRASRLLARQGRPIVHGRLNSGSPLLLDIRDPAHREILWMGETELGTASLLRRLVKPGWSVVDVGANAGFYSFLCADLGARRVLAFEPNPRTAALIARSAQGTLVEVMPAACGESNGKASLYFSPDPGKAAFATIRAEAQWSDDWSAWQAVNVRLVRLDDECDARDLSPDLVKIDAEGAEADVIGGMGRLLTDRVPKHILCEVAAGWQRPDPSPWIACLRDAGYQPFVVSDDGMLRDFAGPVDKSVQNVCFDRA